MRMFSECYELEHLDLSNFNIINTKLLDSMFNQCYKLKEIKGIEKFSSFLLGRDFVSTDGMFKECNELKGCDDLLNTLKNKKSYTQFLKGMLFSFNNIFELPSSTQENDSSKEKIEMLIKCTYDIKDNNNEIQIINDRVQNEINEK